MTDALARLQADVTRDDVLRAIQQYDQLGPERFFSEHGFGPSRSYELVWDKRRYPTRRSWAQLMSSPPASALAPAISRAGRAAPSRCSQTRIHRPGQAMTSKVKADPHVGISAGIGPSCPVRRGRSPAGMAKPACRWRQRRILPRMAQPCGARRRAPWRRLALVTHCDPGFGPHSAPSADYGRKLNSLDCCGRVRRLPGSALVRFGGTVRRFKTAADHRA
jgi:hypothetical protein